MDGTNTVQYSKLLQVGWSGFRTRVGARDFLFSTKRKERKKNDEHFAFTDELTDLSKIFIACI
jgi:hypothetical protein